MVTATKSPARLDALPALALDLELVAIQLDTFLEPSCLPLAERALSGVSGAALRRAVEAFVDLHSDHRSPLDYLAGLVFDHLRRPMQRYYGEVGPALVVTRSSRALAIIDVRLAESIQALGDLFTEVFRQTRDPENSWVASCRLTGLDPFWFAA